MVLQLRSLCKSNRCYSTHNSGTDIEGNKISLTQTHNELRAKVQHIAPLLLGCSNFQQGSSSNLDFIHLIFYFELILESHYYTANEKSLNFKIRWIVLYSYHANNMSRQLPCFEIPEFFSCSHSQFHSFLFPIEQINNLRLINNFRNLIK